MGAIVLNANLRLITLSTMTKAHLANWLTFLRMALTPLVVFWIGWPQADAHLVAAIVFILAALTDYWDGQLARRWQAESSWGRIFDPVADKILVLSTLIALSHYRYVNLWLVLLLLSRDIYVGGLRAYLASQGIILGALESGKWKTAIQMIAVPALLLHAWNAEYLLGLLGSGLLALSTILSWFSALQYTQKAWSQAKHPNPR